MLHLKDTHKERRPPKASLMLQSNVNYWCLRPLEMIEPQKYDRQTDSQACLSVCLPQPGAVVWNRWEAHMYTLRPPPIRGLCSSCWSQRTSWANGPVSGMPFLIWYNICMDGRLGITGASTSRVHLARGDTKNFCVHICHSFDPSSSFFIVLIQTGESKR